MVRFPAGQTCFTLLQKSIPALSPILPYVQWVPGTLSPRMERSGRKARYSHLSSAEVLRLNVAIPLLPHTPSWCMQGQPCILYIVITLE